MKKIISMLLAVLLLATIFCGCSGTEDAPSSSAPTTSSEDPVTSSDPTTSSEPETFEPIVEFADLETFEGAAGYIGQAYSKVPFWKLNIDGTTVKEDKGNDPFNSWRSINVTFDEGRAPTALGLEVAVDSVDVSAFNDLVNGVKIYFVNLSDDDKAKLEQEAGKLDKVTVKETPDKKICVSFES